MGNTCKKGGKIFSTMLVIVLGIVGAYAQPTAIDVAGQVTGADGMPKRFARVQMEGPGNYVAITNTRGQFSINNVNPGRYVATVTQGDNIQRLPVVIDKGTMPVKIAVKW
jgi:hypothetical protein